MSLPPALLKRLAKRGLVEKSKDGSVTAPAEEIIAEDYDDVEEQPYNYEYEYKPKKKSENLWSDRLKKRITDGSISGYKGCPNKYNIYHRCSLFCVNTFGDGFKEPSKSYLERKARLLKRYPLPKEWKEIYDNGIGVFYYWNTVDGTVSWLPPKHPRASIAKSAAIIRKEMEALTPEPDDSEEGNAPSMPIVGGMNVELPGNQDTFNRDVPKMPLPKKAKVRDLDKVLRAKSDRRQKKESNNTPLDPMDPSAYSDVPRGKWSSGLETENKRSGVDSTVTGTAFQARPYPSPGAILQANAAAAAKNDDGNKSNGDHNSDSDN